MNGARPDALAEPWRRAYVRDRTEERLLRALTFPPESRSFGGLFGVAAELLAPQQARAFTGEFMMRGLRRAPARWQRAFFE